MLGIVKKSLKFRSDKNGLFLKIHHTIETDNSEKVKFSFTLIDVSRCSKFFAAIDEGDNAFVFHLSEKCFWQLANFNIYDCSALKFIPLQDSNILVGNKSGFMYEIDINSGTTLRCIKVFSIPINQFLFQRPDMKTIMALSSQQIKIYDLENFVKKSDFIPKDEAEIKFVEQIPHDNRLFVILHHNIICILNSSLKHIRHFEPLKARKHYLKNPRNKIEKLNYSDDEAKSDHETDMDKIINSITRDYSNGYLHSVCFTQNGSSFCLSLMDNSLMFCSTSMWECRRIIKFPDFFIKRFDYIPSHENNPNMLLTLTSNDELMLLNLKTVNSKMLSNSNSIKKFLLSTNRKLLISIQHTGEILVYNFERFFGASVEFDIFSKEEIFTRTNSRAIKHEDKSNERNVGLDEIQIKLYKTLPIKRLLPILKEFGEYPDKYRPLIWKTILKLPSNFNSFSYFLKQQLHSCVANYDKRYPLSDHKALNNLRRIMSCIAHWTPIFGHIQYLPKFVFPFLKVCKKDSMFCFELIATILCNHCQLWFEFAPFQMPFNYFCIIESILRETDRKLFEFYQSKKVTAEIYAMLLMETAFSEILDEQQWMQLWDHIISNDPIFIIFFIVAYNSALSVTIMRCETIIDIEKIFHEPYYVNLKKVLSKAQRLMEKCPPEIHPRLHMKPFTPLTRDEYQKFENYPKHLSDNKVNEIDSLRMEQKILDAKLVEMEAFEKSINTRLENHLIDAEYEQRMREIESSYAKALEEEEERITYQRKMLLLSLKKIREHENETLIHTRNSLLRKQVEASESELESMLRNLQKQRIREEIELQMAEENLKLKEMSQRMQNFEIDTSMRSGTLESRHKTSIESIKSQKQRLMDQLKQLESTTSSTNSTSKVFDGKGEGREETERNCESSFQKIENNFDLMVGKNGRKEDYISRMKKLEIAEKVLEDELHHLLENSDK